MPHTSLQLCLPACVSLVRKEAPGQQDPCLNYLSILNAQHSAWHIMGELYIVLELNRNGMKAEKSEGALLSELPAPPPAVWV